MNTGKRLTLYFRYMDEMRKISEEENIQMNGSMLEELFFQRYLGENENLSVLLKLYYSGQMTYRNMLSGIIEYLAYDSEHRKSQNLEFLKLMIEIVGSSDWRSGNVIEGDYTNRNRKDHVDRIFNIMDILKMHIQERKDLCESSPALKAANIKPWTMEVNDQTKVDILTKKETYEDMYIEMLDHRRDTILRELNNGVTPGRALELIAENWEYLYPYQSTYEAIEYCAKIAENLNENNILKKKIRRFCQRFHK